ncbi:MAG: sulfatase, partial [Planctomycetaceae bacterium]|nr:sulfatase [Planctomycetaceae bacterium]
MRSVLMFAVWLSLACFNSPLPAARPNVLVITVDDMSCDSVGAFGCELPGTTPNIDRLASEGLRFRHAHVQVGNCMPSRNVLWSGRYPHSNQIEGFYQVRSVTWPHLVDLMKGAGYFTGIRGKVPHSTPYSPYPWDVVLDATQDKPHTKEPGSYGESTRLGLAQSREADKPFCLVINVSDPHKPFYGMGKGDREVDDPHRPTHVYTPEDVPIPGFLFDHPDVRRELAHYYSSVRRADDAVGHILQALQESGAAENTLLVFLSDHGMPLPFAKTGLWYHSTHTPLIFRWPGVTAAGSIDEEHLVSSVDMLPTLLDAVEIEAPEGLQGRSYLPLLRQEQQPGWDVVVTEYNENSGGARNPMRAVHTKRCGYIYNPWVNGTREFLTATRGTISYRTMKKLAPQDDAIAARLALFERGVPEEFYDYEHDPDALHNLIDDPAWQAEIDRHRQLLHDWMVRTGDHALEAFEHREDPAVAEAYVERMEAESAARRQGGRRKGRGEADEDAEPAATPARRRAKEQAGLIKLLAPQEIAAGVTIKVRIEHHLPSELGQQSLQVTLKEGKAGKRVARETATASGEGTAVVEFTIPR